MSCDISRLSNKILDNPCLHVVLYQPEIPANTGNIARLCSAAELRLHLIHPLGFRLDDRHLKRAGLDYWKGLDIRQHQGFGDFLKGKGEEGRGRLFAFSKKAPRIYTELKASHGDYLLFGRETVGLPEDILNSYPCYRIPIWGEVRSLNLSTAVGIVVYHYLHEMGRF